jgi:thiosulfate dehydrogenase
MVRFLILFALIMLPAALPADPAAPARKSVNDGSRGARIYMQNCASCHMVDGGGVPGLQPPLIADPVIGSHSPKLLIDVILKGPSSVLPAGGPRYGNTMPAFPSLTDRDTAGLVSFLRRTFGHDTEPVPAATVAAERAP